VDFSFRETQKKGYTVFVFSFVFNGKKPAEKKERWVKGDLYRKINRTGAIPATAPRDSARGGRTQPERKRKARHRKRKT